MKEIVGCLSRKLLSFNVVKQPGPRAAGQITLDAQSTRRFVKGDARNESKHWKGQHEQARLDSELPNAFRGSRHLQSLGLASSICLQEAGGRGLMFQHQQVTVPEQPQEALMRVVPSVLGQSWHLPASLLKPGCSWGWFWVLVVSCSRSDRHIWGDWMAMNACSPSRVISPGKRLQNELFSTKELAQGGTLHLCFARFILLHLPVFSNH